MEQAPASVRRVGAIAAEARSGRTKIYAGELRPGERLPSEPELMATYQVSRTTVRRALLQLIYEGLVQSRQGVGYHVRAVTPLIWVASRPERNTRTDLSPADAWSIGVREQGREPAEDIEVAIVVPPARIATRLGLHDGETAVVRRRARRVDGEQRPHAYLVGTRLEPVAMLELAHRAVMLDSSCRYTIERNETGAWCLVEHTAAMI